MICSLFLLEGNILFICKVRFDIFSIDSWSLKIRLLTDEISLLGMVNYRLNNCEKVGGLKALKCSNIFLEEQCRPV